MPGIYSMVIVSLLHMITAYGSIYLMVAIVCEAESWRTGWRRGEGGEQQDAAAPPARYKSTLFDTVVSFLSL